MGTAPSVASLPKISMEASNCIRVPGDAGLSETCMEPVMRFRAIESAPLMVAFSCVGSMASVTRTSRFIVILNGPIFSLTLAAYASTPSSFSGATFSTPGKRRVRRGVSRSRFQTSSIEALIGTSSVSFSSIASPASNDRSPGLRACTRCATSPVTSMETTDRRAILSRDWTFSGVSQFGKESALSAPEFTGRRGLYKTVVVRWSWSCGGRPLLGRALFALSGTKQSHYQMFYPVPVESNMFQKDSPSKATPQQFVSDGDYCGKRSFIASLHPFCSLQISFRNRKVLDRQQSDCTRSALSSCRFAIAPDCWPRHRATPTAYRQQPTRPSVDSQGTSSGIPLESWHRSTARHWHVHGLRSCIECTRSRGAPMVLSVAGRHGKRRESVWCS